MNTCARSILLLSSRTSSLLHLSDAKTNGVRDFCIILWISCTLPDCAHLPSRGQPWAESSNLCGFDQDSDMKNCFKFHPPPSSTISLQEHLGKWWSCTEKWWKAFWVVSTVVSIDSPTYAAKKEADGRPRVFRIWQVSFATEVTRFFRLSWINISTSNLTKFEQFFALVPYHIDSFPPRMNFETTFICRCPAKSLNYMICYLYLYLYCVW